MQFMNACLMVAFVLGAAGCGGYDPTASTQSIELVKVSGGGKDLTIITEVDRHDSLVVKVVDQKGRPVSGEIVSWTQSDPDGKIEPATLTTGPGGTAWAKWSVSGFPGRSVATASIEGHPPVDFDFVARSWSPRQVEVGWQLACAISSDGDLACASNLQQQLRFQLRGRSFSQLAWTPDHNGVNRQMCALEATGRVWCARTQAAPVTFQEVAGDYPPFATIAAGQYGALCGAPRSGGLWCWGRGKDGLRADGVNSIASWLDQPVEMLTTDAPIIDLHIAGDMACALELDGDVWCWGQNEGKLIDPQLDQFTRALLPRKIDSMNRFTTIAVSGWGGSICGIAAGGRTICWGRADQSGVGVATEFVEAPGRVAAENISVLAPGSGGSYFGITAEGELLAWGTYWSHAFPVTRPERLAAAAHRRARATFVQLDGTDDILCIDLRDGGGLACTPPQVSWWYSPAWWHGVRAPID